MLDQMTSIPQTLAQDSLALELSMSSNKELAWQAPMKVHVPRSTCVLGVLK